VTGAAGARARTAPAGAPHGLGSAAVDAVEGVRIFWEEAFNGRRLDLVDDLLAPGYENHAALPGTPPGAEGQRQLMERLWEAFPDGRFEIEHLALAGDTVICVGTMSGTHSGVLLGVPASGRAVRWRMCHLMRVDADGRGLEHRAIRDDLDLMRQMGALPE
jgi:predicted ester cyclase